MAILSRLSCCDCSSHDFFSKIKPRISSSLSRTGCASVPNWKVCVRGLIQIHPPQNDQRIPSFHVCHDNKRNWKATLAILFVCEQSHLQMLLTVSSFGESLR